MSHQASSPLPGPFPIAPTEEEWSRMSPAERERFVIHVLDALSDPRLSMSEGRPHKRAKSRALDMLGLHFKTLGRTVYLAEEMAVLYPGEEIFSPDVLAVLDVPQPDDDARLAWVVADERKGLDFVLEVLHRGDRNKDLVLNVERYGRLGIPEYFVYDRAQQKVHGHRLPSPEARRYQRIVPQGGRYHSMVLGVDLAIEDGSLRFYQGSAELFGSDDLIRRLTGMVEGLETKADKAEAEALQARAEAEQAQARAEKAVSGLRTGILTVLEARGLACSDEARDELRSCDDPDTLQRWLARAAIAGSAAEVFSAQER